MIYESYEKFVETADPSVRPILASFKDDNVVYAFEKLQELGWPEVVDVLDVADSKNHARRRDCPRSLNVLGYKIKKCPETKDGRWKINGKKRTLYSKEQSSINTMLKLHRNHLSSILEANPHWNDEHRRSFEQAIAEVDRILSGL